MLRYALRRIFWAFPTLFGVSLVVFLLTTLMPEPPAPPVPVHNAAEQALEQEERLEARFLDLPRFVNPNPRDVRVRANECVDQIAQDAPLARLCALRLQRLGGAALPHVLPRLEMLSPAERGRVAGALAPLGERVGIHDAAGLRDAAGATRLWARFWEDHALDFTEPAVRRNAQRLAQRESAENEAEIAIVDTFALPVLMATIETTPKADGRARLLRVAARITGRPGLAPGATAEDVDKAAGEWRAWWFVHQAKYTTYDGGTRIAAAVTDTRYARWTYGSVSGRLGLSTRDGKPVFEKLLSRAPVTLTITFLAMLVSLAAAVPLGVVTAWRRGRAVDVAAAVVLVVVYSLPSFWVAQIMSRLFDHTSWLGLAAPVLSLSIGSLALLSRQQRSALLDVLSQDYVRTAHAKGVSRVRVLFVHSLRNAIVPTLALAGMQFPSLFGGAFVVEEVFGIQGMGWETLRAIEAQDIAWLVAVVLFAGAITTLMLIVADLGRALLDPTLREGAVST
ncbi:MAG: ABC transporter permease [Myxococcales bacterium]|jgi:ABC-type dipeptide/oligopeptide/nickel transport system permease component|nr:ABC transporter permease [Myxococcales bacterium]